MTAVIPTQRWFGNNLLLQESVLEPGKFCLPLPLNIIAVNDNGKKALHGGAYLGGTLLVPLLVDRVADVKVATSEVRPSG